VHDTTRESKLLAVLFLDLDDFKSINDRLGHQAGDTTLRLVADRIRHCLRPGDFAARLGGDEFVVVVEGLSDADRAGTIAQRIADEIVQPLKLDQGEPTVGVSIGIATCQPGLDAPSPQDLLVRADHALYRAKNAGKGRFAY